MSVKLKGKPNVSLTAKRSYISLQLKSSTGARGRVGWKEFPFPKKKQTFNLCGILQVLREPQLMNNQQLSKKAIVTKDNLG